MRFRLPSVCLCCAALGLAACGGDGGGGASLAELEQVRDRLAEAEAERKRADEALEEAQTALAAAQRLLRAGASGDAEARTQLGATLAERSRALEAAVQALPPAAEDESGARSATREALAATRTALDLLAAAVREADAAAAPVAAAAHTALDRAQTAMTAALDAVADAQELLAETPDPAASDALLQAQNALLTAQLSLTPVIRGELDESRTDLAAARDEVTRLTGVVTARTSERDKARGDLAAAQAEVTRLTGIVNARTGELETRTGERDKARRDLAAAQAEVARLTGVVTARTGERNEAQRDLAAARAEVARLEGRIDLLFLQFGEDVDTPSGSPLGSGVERTRRMALGGADGVTLSFHEGFKQGPGSLWGEQTRYTAAGGTYTPAEAPDPVGWTEDTPMLFGTETPPETHLPGRGTIFRGELRAPQANADATRAAGDADVDVGDLVLASSMGGYQAKDRLVIQGRRTADSSAPSFDGAAADGLIRAEDAKDNLYGNWDAVPRTSFRYDPEGGFTMSFGATADGALIFGDLEPLAAKGGVSGDLDRDNRVTQDIEISFGAPSADPYGERGYWWLIEAPSPKRDLVRDSDGNPVTTTAAAGNHMWMSADGQTQQEDGDGNPLYVTLDDDPLPGILAGSYDAFLSNHAGPDAGEDGTVGTDDDEQRYLRYAAYGLFSFVDYNTASARPGRIQTFHYGFDAFDSDADTATPPVPEAADVSIAATFAGKTAGWVLLPLFRSDEASTTLGSGRFNHCGSAGTARCERNFVNQLIRLRGNVELSACIGGGGCAGIAVTDPNAIEGTISDFEYSPVVGYWTDRDTAVIDRAWRTLHGSIGLAGTIAADGVYAGAATPTAQAEPTTQNMDRDPYMSAGGYPMATTWGVGEFEGVFYGPIDALETAGTWWVPARENIWQYAGMVGSFGAACTDCGDE